MSSDRLFFDFGDSEMNFEQVRQSIASNFGNDAALYFDEWFPRDQLIHFEGQTCNDHMSAKDLESCQNACTGWNGLSKRCNCYNHRVEWVWEPVQEYSTSMKEYMGRSHSLPNLYARAY